MYEKDQFMPLSALQHMIFCKRQCALIHIEQQWIENQFTAEGRILHERVDRQDTGIKGTVKIEYGLPLKSAVLGVTGKADVVEFHRQEGGGWLPFPVEYKRGKAKKDNSDKVQLCAQAICLEEMLTVSIEKGALFYGKTRRRLDVEFTELLRNETLEVANALHEMFRAGITPGAKYHKKCDTCSFYEICKPRAFQKKRSISAWLEKQVRSGTDDK
ncbi:MAG: CRISPR-associated protein Cas4 [Desulfamplus sp.]|nr:CRISPR-associated protein Cas4 [Desulfamplus sp.]